jgi:hypothetical protein|tara:strand:+ start:11472 stop:12737 length:1266 start_codon:yes stop_codon:yes gene_type:complete
MAIMTSSPLGSPGLDDTSRLHDHALARAFAELSPSGAADPPARFSPGKFGRVAPDQTASHDVVVPAAVKEAMRLQALARFARRKDTQTRTRFPSRKGLVKEAKVRSVCGTGVAGRKVLGTSTKLKIDLIIESGGAVATTFGRVSANEGIRNCATSITDVHHKSGAFSCRNNENGFANNDHVSALGLFDDPDAVARRVGFDSLRALAPPAPRLPNEKGWSVAGCDTPSMRSERESGYREVTGLGTSTSGAPPGVTISLLPDGSDDAERDAFETVPRLNPRDSAKERSFGRDAKKEQSETFMRPSETLVRQDTAFDAEILEEMSQEMHGPSKKAGGDGETEERMGEKNDGHTSASSSKKEENNSDVSVLDALRAAGAVVRSLSLEERKQLFEVAVQEHVTQLTNQLFPPEDGLNPKVHIDVAI